MGRSGGTSHDERHREDRKDVNNLDSDENDRKKRHGDRSSHRRRHRRDDDDEDVRPRRRSLESEDEKHGSKHSSSINRRKDEHHSKRHKKEHRKHSRRYSEDDTDDSRSVDDSRDAKRRKRHRDHDDEKRRSKTRKHKDASHRDRDPKMNVPSEATKLQVNKKDLFPLGDKLGNPPDTLLHPENDYFEQNQRLRLYLYRECGMTFDDLSSEEARKAFHDFVQRYNAGDLETGYYSATLPVEAVEQCPSTRHKWSLKLSNQDAQNLQLVQKGIRKQTEYQGEDGSNDTTAVKRSTSTNLPRNSFAPSANSTTEPQPDEVGPRPDRSNDRSRNRRLREESQLVMEEFTGGRAEGRERLIEKRQERASLIHGANKYAPEVELDDAALYGGGSSDDFRRALAASQKRAAVQEAKKQARIEELQQKEEEKKLAMLQMLGLSHKIGQSKIQIPPRNDPPDG